jgi:hypothetical protein
MSASALTFVTWAMQDLGVLSAGATPDGGEGADGLSVLNQLADSWGLSRGLMYTLVRSTKTLASGTASYTLGSGGDINIVRPQYLEDARLVQDTVAATPVEVRLDILTDAQYAAWPQKTEQQGQSRAVWYDRSWTAGLGRVYPLPIPNVGTTQLVLYTPGDPVGQFANLSTVYTFPHGYERALRKVLALELAPMYRVRPGVLLIRQASEAVASIQRSNVPRTTRENDRALTRQSGGVWDMNTGAFR